MLKQIFKEKRLNLNIKLTKEEFEIVRANADMFTRGNVSAWVRIAATKLKPPKSMLMKE